MSLQGAFGRRSNLIVSSAITDFRRAWLIKTSSDLLHKLLTGRPQTETGRFFIIRIARFQRDKMLRFFVKIIFLLAALVFIIMKNQGGDRRVFFKQPAEEPAHQSEISFFDGKYQDLLNSYSLRQPGDAWRLAPSHNSKNLVKLDITHASGKYGLQVRVYDNSGQDFAEFVKSYIAAFQKDMDNPDIIDQKDFAGDGVVGTAISFDGRKRNGYYLKSYVFPGQKFFYAIQGGCPFADKDILEPDLDEIAATFKPL